MSSKKIAIDFDGVIAEYNGWKGETVTGKPYKIDELKAFINYFKSNGYSFIIYTCRNIEVINQWLITYNLQEYFIDVTNKKPIAEFYIDDRAIRFNGDYEDCIESIHKQEKNNTWWKANKSYTDIVDYIEQNTTYSVEDFITQYKLYKNY